MAGPLKLLQLGCGSMGSRRLRDLSVRPDVTLRLYDQREDRRAAAQRRFQVAAFRTLDEALAWEPDALVISTPPGTKGPLVQWALDHRIHHFVEADLWSYGAAIQAERHPELVSAPSLTFAFLPVVQALQARIPAEIGQLLTYQFLLAGDMAAWHPTEGMEYYGRHRDTAPAREMVPFELAWLAAIFGSPRAVCGDFGRFCGRTDSIEDTWSLLLALEAGGTGQVTVTMACPDNHRCGTACGTTGSVRWDINRGEIVLQGNRRSAPEVLQCGEIGRVIEPAYAAEIGRFVEAIQGKAIWPHRYADYQHAIATLAAAEQTHSPQKTHANPSSRSSRWSATSGRAGPGWLSIEPNMEPSRILPRRPE